MAGFIGAVAWLSRASGVVAVGLLAAAVLAVNHLVVVRYVLNESAIWQHEFVTYSLIGATILGSPYVLLKRGHVSVDLLPLALPHKARFALALIAAALGLAFCVVLAVTGAGFWYEAAAKGWVAETVWAPPLWIPYLAVPLGMGLVALQYLADIVALLTGRAPPFGIDDEARE
jgi:TRAP-type C4-dicarboxylate transport system permease small subunit